MTSSDSEVTDVMETMEIDGSVYPDVEVPDVLRTPEDRADYVHRICGAWDFGLPPSAETVRLFRNWRDVFDRFTLRHSPAYAAFRALYGWPPVAGSILSAPYEEMDAAEGRSDGCEDLV